MKKTFSRIVNEKFDASLGHIAGGFARHRFDLKGQMQQAQPAQVSATVASASLPIEKPGTVVGRGEVATGVVQQIVHQIQHQPHLSTSSQRASTSMSAAR